ncbi:ribosomal protein S18-alanine N-acetyltransferase [Sporomusa acidovorans]|uniref:[Ribosomal protein bS18]-alanine N-acetyltransferase n=1 Tax=Sporomusa acidovorans (strain ATCC 49682 / DSM 3132 / Mol) TaxID=1123286 RepID=A0ABZ3IZ97_SPOA4|nr:ribosomal protein S18-alanine N-acetyltransferase [Sporomusa acidovorans]OZC19172.1 mycothiol acetyltransferase [Sporomusa acidovorans DSM 3132]SDF11710.1 ribosomal-protein-alanine N-acetyltransferase [Sporomusa acidovorans]
MADEVCIRSMLAADVDAVLAVEQQAFETPWSRAAFEEEMENDLAHYLVVVGECKLMGYGGFWLVLDEAHVTNIALSPPYQGRGLGSLLLEHMIFAAKSLGAVSMTLEVRPSNAAARKLYARRGFVERGVRPNYYAELGEDALIMWLDKL